MARGQLEARAWLEPSALWPSGSADADTLRLTLADPHDAFRFRAGPDRAFARARSLASAWVVGRVRRKLVDAAGRFTVRLEGVDAPELHYRPLLGAGVSARSRWRG